MKVYMTLLLTGVLMVGCSSKPASKESQTPANAPSAPAKVETPQSAPAQQASASAVDLVSCEMTPDKANLAYKIKVNTSNPIEEVHLAVKETDAGGKVLEETTIVWQNIAHSTRQPIENGKTYEDQSSLIPETAKADCSLKEVVFKDGTRWSPK